MSHGLLIQNSSNQIIVSNDTSTFYYYGMAEIVTVAGTPEYGGVTVRLYNTHTSAPIIPFINPKDGNMVAITRIFRGANNYWQIEVATSSAYSVAPEVIIFTTADAEEWTSRFSLGDRDHGLVVRRADGSKAFDSSVGQPLAVRGSLSAIPPTEPTAGGTDLTPVNYNAYGIPAGITTPMFGYYSLAMAERQYQVNQVRRDCTGIGYGGVCIGFTDTVVQSDLYWAFYRSACAIAGSELRCGWLTYSKGHLTTTQTSSGFSVFIPIIGLGGGDYTSGNAPFVNETINLTAATVLLADRASYANTSYTFTYPASNAPVKLTATTDTTGDGVTHLEAAWENSPVYPFAASYNVYWRPVGQSYWNSGGNTNLTTWGISGVPFKTVVDGANNDIFYYYDVMVVSVNPVGQEGGSITATSVVYIAPPPVTGGPDYSGGDGGGGGDAGGSAGDSGDAGSAGDSGSGSGDSGSGSGDSGGSGSGDGGAGGDGGGGE